VRDSCYYLPTARFAYLSGSRCPVIWNPQKAKKYQCRDDSLRRELDHVLWLFRAYEQATASTMIRTSWMTTGFSYETRDAATYLIVNEIKFRQGDVFRELWLSSTQKLKEEGISKMGMNK
jgi:hypothetical protein